MVFFGWEVPLTWLQALDAAISMCTMLGTMVFWRWWAERREEPDELTKMSLGAFIACTAPLLMVVASGLAEQSGQRLSLLWTVSYNLLNNVGFALVMPVGLALFSRAAPGRLAGLMIGCYYLYLFAGNTLTGQVSASGTDVSLRSSGDLLLDQVTAAGALTLQSGGHITQQAGSVLSATGNTTVTTDTSHDVSLDKTANQLVGSVAATGRQVTLGLKTLRSMKLNSRNDPLF
jgi:dipeptide/tripeptide permease